MHKQTLALFSTAALAGCLGLEEQALDQPYDDSAYAVEEANHPSPTDELGEASAPAGLANDSQLPTPLMMSSSPATGEPMFYVDSFVAADGTGRYIERHGDASIGLIMDENYDSECEGVGYVGGQQAKFWKESWIQSDPVEDDYCGPVAARNLLNWYGECVDFDQLGAEMRTNHSLAGIEWWGACAAFCGLEIAACANICYGILQAIDVPGSRGVDVSNTLAAHTPDGYNFYQGSGRAALARLLAPLSEGNPVIALINSGRYMNHYVVVTGTYWLGSTLMLRLANNRDLNWAEFEEKWSLVGFGDDFENSIRDEVMGDNPYTYMYYSRGESRWDVVIRTSNDCAVEAASLWDKTAKFTFDLGDVCYYRDFDRCPSNAVSDRGRNHELRTCYCDAADSGAGSVWGSDVYTDDSDLCRAALHAGVKGVVTYEILPGQASYDSSARYQVVSQSYASYSGSFAFARPNLALARPARSSSSRSGGVAARAVDGTTDGTWGLRSVSHTEDDAQAWWEVDLGAATPVGAIELYNRTDCCSDRLADFDVILLGDDRSEVGRIHHADQVGESVSLTANRLARYVRVQLVGSGYLSLAEVKVFAMANLALGKSATQSSVSYGAGATRAVDGITSGAWNDASVTHTNSQAQPWWEVDLGSSQAIGDLVIHNRTDCCSSRLSDFAIVLFNGFGAEVKRFEHPGIAGAITSFEINHAARYVHIELNGSGVLSLAEVKVFPIGLGEKPESSQVIAVTYYDRSGLGDLLGDGDGPVPDADSDIEVIELDGYFSVEFTTSPEADLYRVRFSTSATDPTPHTTEWFSGFFTSHAAQLTPCVNNYIRIENKNEFGTTLGPIYVHYADDGTCSGGGTLTPIIIIDRPRRF